LNPPYKQWEKDSWSSEHRSLHPTPIFPSLFDGFGIFLNIKYKLKKGWAPVFAELNTGGELCKKDKLPSIIDASSIFYFYYVLCHLSY